MIKRLLAWIRAQFTEAHPPAPYIWPQSERPDNDRILLEQHQLALMEQIDQVSAERRVIRALPKTNWRYGKLLDLDEDIRVLNARLADIDAALEKYLGD